jgi:two-component system, NtrC family, sensor kinase
MSLTPGGPIRREKGSQKISARAAKAAFLAAVKSRPEHILQPAHLPRRTRSPSLSSAAAVKAAKGRPMRQRPKSLKPKAKLPVAPESPKDEDARVRDLEKRLAEALKLKTEALKREADALEQQTATSEILRVIASSPTDVQPVFDAVAESAARLCEAFDAAIFRRDGDDLRLVAHHGPIPIQSTLPLVRGTSNGRAVLSGQTVHVADMQTEAAEFPEGSENARRMGHRTVLAVPLIREEGVAIGTINVRRTEAHLFTDRQVNLLRTFAAQAVIAIENVRLFTETKEALERQTATSEILRVISSSPTDIQPVLDAVAESAVRLCQTEDVLIFRHSDDRLRLVAHHGTIAADNVGEFSLALGPGTVGGRALIERRTIHVADILAASVEFPESFRLAHRNPRRTIMAVPLLREGQAIGFFLLRRPEVRPFSDKQVALAESFAHQAVIAIENVRLFTELQASNRELTTALDTQTATSDILRVISRSQTNVQPVFNAILSSAVRLLRGYSGVVTRIAGDRIELAGLTSTDEAGDATTRAVFPQSHQTNGPHVQATRDRAPINIAEAQTDPRVPEAERANARARGFRGWVIVPLLRQDEAVGTIAVTRRESGGFTDDEIALLKTFADQAVIAIENARLLSELQARTQELTRSVGELQALGEVGRASAPRSILRPC